MSFPFFCFSRILLPTPLLGFVAGPEKSQDGVPANPAQKQGGKPRSPSPSEQACHAQKGQKKHQGGENLATKGCQEHCILELSFLLF